MKLTLALLAVSLCAVAAHPTGDQMVSVTQDSAGNYKLNLNIHGMARAEQGNADGSVSGGYSYYDSDGVLRMIQYTAGVDGFRATGDHLPVAPLPVADTPEVAAARAQHLAALRAAN